MHYALQYRDAGHTIEETYQWVSSNAQRVIHWFTVSDLHFLRRGGRLSAASAYLGTILKIKPVLNVDPLGRLVPRIKVQGRKHSLKELYEQVEKTALEPQKQTMFLSHVIGYGLLALATYGGSGKPHSQNIRERPVFQNG